MRVTNKMMTDTVSANLFKQANRLLAAQEVVATEKIINRPSDDPIGMEKILDYRKAISSIEQYHRNLTQGKMWVEHSEVVLDEVNDMLRQAKEIAVVQSEGSSPRSDRAIAAEQVKTIYDQVMQLANTKLGDRYMFAGHETGAVPFTRDAAYNATYHGDAGEIRIIIGENTDLAVNADGMQVFNNGTDTFDVLRQLKDALENPVYNQADISNQIQSLVDASSQVESARSDGAANYTRLELTESKLEVFKLNVKNMLSNTEDADMAQAIITLKNEETAYETALAAAAEVIQPSLINFLK
ncbi:MAG: flagellar hook-associated protein FlgL [Thermodesulfobacteriota bacterium]|nr:flagellar hook-associated protein FlgL [Thermodesulfobacteriota bacterium]